MSRIATLAVINLFVAGFLVCCGSPERDPESSDSNLRDAVPVSGSPDQWLERCDSNPNGRVTCREARADGCGAQLPVSDDHPLYQFMTDRDGDGLVCE